MCPCCSSVSERPTANHFSCQKATVNRGSLSYRQSTGSTFAICSKGLAKPTQCDFSNLLPDALDLSPAHPHGWLTPLSSMTKLLPEQEDCVISYGDNCRARINVCVLTYYLQLSMSNSVIQVNRGILLLQSLLHSAEMLFCSSQWKGNRFPRDMFFPQQEARYQRIRW